MDIDIYQPCPCHAEKKIKFCCGKEVIGDLNEVLSLNKGRQSIAALDQINRAIAKLGPRDCLLTLKTRIQLALNHIDDANETNELFRKTNPKHAMGHHHRALVMAARNDSAGAVSALQDSLDSIKSVQVPVAFANAYRVIGLLLLSQGFLMAARAHLRFAMSLRRNDEQLKQLFLQTWQLPGLPLLMRHEFGIHSVDTNEPWAEGYKQAQVFGGAGRWRKSRRLFLKLDEQHPDVPEIQHAIAALSTWLGSGDMDADWKRYSENKNLSLDLAVDATAYWMLMSDTPLTNQLDIVRITYSVNDVSACSEAATASDQLLLSQQVYRDPNADESAPAPKSGYAVLNRAPARESSDELDSIPLVVAEAFIFSKQTDRPGRIEVIGVESDQFTETRRLIESIFETWIEGEVEREVIGEISELDDALRARLKLPDGLTDEQYTSFLSRQRERIYLSVAPNIKFLALGNKSLREVASDPSHQRTSLAIIELLEQSAEQDRIESFDFNRLRAELNLPEQMTLEVNKVNLQNLSPSLESRLPHSELDDQVLIGIYVKSMTNGNINVLRKVGQEMLGRPKIMEQVHAPSLLTTLAQISIDNQQALDYAKQARELAVADGENEGMWLINELDIRLDRGISEGCEEIVRILRTRFQGDQEVEVSLIRTLQSHGLVGPQGQVPGANQPGMNQMPRMEPSSEAPPESTIWTPDQGISGTVQSGSTREAGESGGSKLWIPD